MSIRIVTHCYAERLPQYAVFLRTHLTSLLRFPCKTDVNISVYYTKSDKRTVDVLNHFHSLLNDRLDIIHMEPTHLYRRTIGRNHGALNAKEDLVWFADGDFCFGESCLDVLEEQNKKIEGPVGMMWPKHIMGQIAHAQGDAFFTENLDGVDELEPDYSEFKIERAGFAYGGLQIVRGNFARQHGYLNDPRFSKWMRPRTDGKPFGDTLEDKEYRRFCQHVEGGGLVGIELPNLFRLRHSDDARDSRKKKGLR